MTPPIMVSADVPHLMGIAKEPCRITCLALLLVACCLQLFAADFVPPLPIDPALNQNVEIWMTPDPPSGPQTGTETEPYSVGGAPVTFDKFMSRFRGTRYVTFRLKPGIYHTSGVYEVPLNRAVIGDWWEPGTGWRILGSGTNVTILEMDAPKELTPTKFHVIGNPFTGGLVHHLEIAYLTLNANGPLHSQRVDSSFGAIYVGGSYIYLHDLNCIGAFNALSPLATNARTHRELFIIGIGGRDGAQVTNNIIRRCVITIPPGNPKPFPGSIEALTTAILNAANANGRDAVNDLTCVPQITECLVVGNDVAKRVNGISIFGATNGLATSNVVLNVRFGFYSDDSPWNPSLYVAQNFFSNSIHGVYLNYSMNPAAQWGSVAVLSNVIYLSNRWSNESSNFTAGINLFGTGPGAGPTTFDQVVVASNTITTVGGQASARIHDFGILQQGARRGLTIGNRIGVLRDENSLKVLPDPLRDETNYFCNNQSFAGTTLWAHDRSLPGCYSDSPPRPQDCLIPPVCLEPSPFANNFKFALTLPSRHPYPSARLPGRHWVWEAEDGDVLLPSFIAAAPDASGGRYVVSTNRDQGGVHFAIYLPLSTRKYNLWAKIQTASTGFFDVEIDGERRFFGATQEGEKTEWVYRLVTERIPVSNTNTTRRVQLDPGWHSIAFWTRDPSVRLDQLCITTSTEDDFVPNATIVARLQLSGKISPAEIANDCPSDQTFEAETGILTPPMEIITNALASSGMAVRSSISDRGDLILPFNVPRTQNYSVQFRIQAANRPSNANTARVFVDGQEWVVSSGTSTGWVWTSLIDDTEKSINALSSSSKVFHLTQGPHKIRWRTRNPGVLFDSLRVTAVPSTR